MQFRKDINGLRAIAVIAVVLFHFNPSWMSGGFAGVDVFFVISGFLMTGIIFRGLEQQNLSILKFYIARANRIIPALAALCFILLLFGWFYLGPLDYKVLAKHAGSSIGFISNIVYWQESGYFDSASLEKWLLHTWSLSVEWQFYIIYPLILVILSKFLSLTQLKIFIVASTIVGFIGSVIITYQWPSAAYYLLPSRAWQMLLGGIAYLYPFATSNKNKRILELTGLALIIASYIFITEDHAWPGYLSLAPVLGAFLIIQAQLNNSIITSNFIFQQLGKWSYSIYLWHWPIVVGIYYFSLNSNYIYYGIALSVALGYLSYTFIEKIKFTNNYKNLFSLYKCKPIYITLLIGIFSSYTFINDGIVNRLSEQDQLKYASAKEAIKDWGYPKANLKIDDFNIRFIKGSSDKNILFIGASHIEQTYPYAAAFGSEYNIYYLTYGGCSVSASFIRPGRSCANIQNYEEIIKKIGFDKIVTSIYTLNSFLSKDLEKQQQQLAERTADYDKFLRFAKDNSQSVFMLLGEPKGPEFDPKVSIRKRLNNYITVEQARKNYTLHYRALEQLEELEGVTVIDPINYLCDEKCMVMDEDYNFFYKDEHHMRPWYAIKSLGYLDRVLEHK